MMTHAPQRTNRWTALIAGWLLACAWSVGSWADEGAYSRFGVSGFHALDSEFLSERGAGTETLRTLAEDEDRAHRVTAPSTSFVIPVYRRGLAMSANGQNHLQAWGLKWQHWLDSDNNFAVTAGRGENQYRGTTPLETTSAMAAVSWTSRWQEYSDTSLTGGFFVGDEFGRPENEQELDRRYYGITLDGQVTVFRKHTPYVSLKLQKSEFGEDFGLYPDGGYGYFSRLSAGWDWKILHNWNVRAEANYTLKGEELDRQGSEGSRIFFGTRYDFR